MNSPCGSYAEGCELKWPADARGCGLKVVATLCISRIMFSLSLNENQSRTQTNCRFCPRVFMSNVFFPFVAFVYS